MEGTASNLIKTYSPISGVCAFRECLALWFEMTNEPVFLSRQSTLEKVGRLGIQQIENRCLHNFRASRQFSCASQYVRCISVNSSYMYSAMTFTKSFSRCYQDNILSDDVIFLFCVRSMLQKKKRTDISCLILN